MKETKIVIATAEKITAANLKKQLSELGYQVVGAAADSFRAIKLCKLLNPDLIIIDINNIPKYDDLKAARIIKKSLRIPVIIISTWFDETLLEAVTQAGVFAFLVKPVAKQNLAPAIEVALRNHLNYCRALDELNRLRQIFRNPPDNPQRTSPEFRPEIKSPAGSKESLKTGSLD